MIEETSEQIAARVAANLPPYLRMTPEKQQEEDEAQALRRASFTRSKLTEEERIVAHGMKVEEIALSNLQLARNEEELNHWQRQYAQGLELQGKYEEAADVHPDEGEKNRLRSWAGAVAKDDAEYCQCEAEKATLNGQDIEVHPHYEVKRIYSRRHNGMVSLVGCQKCSALNATSTPPTQLATILHAHRASHQVVKLGQRPAVKETEVLRGTQGS
jgi:hypothetical protein